MRRLSDKCFSLMKHRLAQLILILSSLFFAAQSIGQQKDVWIDVRTAREYRAGHLEGAINIPHGDIGHKIFEAAPDIFSVVHIYDSSNGTFAGLALEILMELGYQEVVNEGGYEQLLKKTAANPGATSNTNN